MGEVVKTTLELPDELMRAAKIRAASEGRRLREVMADLIRRGLEDASGQGGEIQNRVEFPLVRCAHAATPAEAIDPERVAQILADEEVQAYRGSA